MVFFLIGKINSTDERNPWKQGFFSCQVFQVIDELLLLFPVFVSRAFRSSLKSGDPISCRSLEWQRFFFSWTGVASAHDGANVSCLDFSS